MNLQFLLIAAAVVLVYSSSHSEAPGTASSPRSDLTDVYMFRSYDADGSRDDFVNLMFNVNPLQSTLAGPNYSPLASDFVYNFHIDNTGDAQEDITFQFLVGATFNGEFDETTGIHEGFRIPVGPTGKLMKVPLAHIGQVNAQNDESVLNYYEHFKLRVYNGPSSENSMIDEGPFASSVTSSTDRFRIPFSYAGTKTFGPDPAYETYSKSFVHDVNIPGCAHPAKVFVGQREDPFYVNLGQIFDLINFSPAPSREVLGDDDKKFNSLYDKAVTSFGIEIHESCVRGASDGKIGAWASVQHLKHVGPDHAHKATSQKNRLGNPLVNELLVGMTDKDGWNKRHPSQDVHYRDYYEFPTIPELVEILFGDTVRSAVLDETVGSLAPHFFPRADLYTILLTGIPGVNQQSATQPPSDLLRLNLDTPITRRADQNPIGIIVPVTETNDFAGYPNGRRPGDDTVDITLRAAMGRLCHPPFDEMFKICAPADAPIGAFLLTDRAPINARDFADTFPWFNSPLPGDLTRQ